jgi:hypothetical protein
MGADRYGVRRRSHRFSAARSALWVSVKPSLTVTCQKVAKPILRENGLSDRPHVGFGLVFNVL